MDRQSGQKKQQRIWEETKTVLEGVPGVSDIYKTIGGK